jgi:hypothetical protein
VELLTPKGEVLLPDYLGEWEKVIFNEPWPRSAIALLGNPKASNLFRFSDSKSQSYTIDVSPRLTYSLRGGVVSEKSFSLRAMPIRASNTPITYDVFDDSPCLKKFLTDVCYVAYELDPGFELKIKISTVRSPSGWVSGRILSPKIESSSSASQNVLTISGGFVPTPALSKYYRYSDQQERDVWSRLSAVFGLPWDWACGQNGGPCSAGTAVYATQIDRFLAAVEIDKNLDTAKSVQQKLIADFSWEPQIFTSNGKTCQTAGLAGFSGSNALTYENLVPKFDLATQELTYRIASPHQLPSGQEFPGVYELLLKRDLANCLWGLSAVAPKVSVAVVSSDNQAKAHVTTNRVTSDWVSMSVYGFTYSETKVKVKLQNGVQPTAPAGKKTIICFNKKKPNVTKKITAINPKCPAGFQKK